MYQRKVAMSAVLIHAFLLARPVFAVPDRHTGGPPSPLPDVAAPAKPQTLSRRNEPAAVLLFGAGAISVVTGAIMAAGYSRPIGGCAAPGQCSQESLGVPVGLGLLLAGGTMGAFGLFFWQHVPHTDATIGFAPSGLTVSGRF